MISKMNNLAQVIGIEPAVSGFWKAARAVVWLVAILSSGCRPEPSNPSVVAAFPSAVAPSPGILAPLSTDVPGHPLADWTFADSLEEIHAIWCERFERSAQPALDPNAVWPYADAVRLGGDSWGLSAESTKVVYIDSDHHAYQRLGALHPTGKGPLATMPPDSEASTALAWAAVQTGPELLRIEAGSGFRVAGPVRAGTTCLVCHDYAPDTVVAVLLYDFQEIADD